jgi:dTDP-4-amino-4,6-dideoxygalactose transaminase
MTDIPLVDLKAAYAEQRQEIDAAVAEVVQSTQFINGPQVAAFEEEFAAFCGARRAVGTGSGTAALHLSLAAIGIGPGDVVAVPAHTFIASVEPITWLGATPRFVDVEEATGCLDPMALKSAIDGAKAVVPVHLYGCPADLDAIGRVADDAGAVVIEDAAQAQGAVFVDRAGRTYAAGTHGRAGCFSFFPGKNLGAYGDAGAVVTHDDDLARAIAMLRDHGRTQKYEHSVVGYAHRLDTIQAAVLRVRLAALADGNLRRRAIAAAYSRHLAGIGDLVLPPDLADRRSVFHLYVVRTRHRDGLLAHLRTAGISAGVHYPLPVHRQPAYAHLHVPPGSLPITEAWARECLSLPIYPQLSDDAVARVSAAVGTYFEMV